MTPVQRLPLILQERMDKKCEWMIRGAERIKGWKAEDEANGIVWAIGSATVATREPSQVSQSRPFGRVSTIARGDK